MRPQPPLGRSAGLVVPLFSLHSARGAGIGEIGDLAPLGAWMRRAGLQALQLLPVGHAAGRRDLAVLGAERDGDRPGLRQPGRRRRSRGARRRGAAAAGRPDRASRARAARRACSTAPCDRPRRARCAWPSACSGTSTGCAPRARAGAFAAFVSWEEWWLADYALYCALRERHGHRPWTEWPAPLRDRRSRGARARPGANWSRRSSFISTCSGSPTRSGRRRASSWARSGCSATFPFMVSTDSADVWAHQHVFRFDRTVGTPPDAFSATGQDWGLPVYRWDVMAGEDDRWLRQRARRMARLYDGYRVDHLVGFFRTYSRDAGRDARRLRPRRRGRRSSAQGERILQLFIDTGAQVTAEDLGLDSRLRARVAGAPAACPATRCCAGSATGIGQGSRCSTRRRSRPSRWPRPARTTSSRSRCGGSCSTTRERAETARRCSDLPPRRDGRVRRRRPRRAARAGLRRGLRSAAAADSGRLRVARSRQHAGDRRRRRTGRGSCRWASRRCRPIRRALERADALQGAAQRRSGRVTKRPQLGSSGLQACSAFGTRRLRIARNT